jgi:hypothetical protein
MDAALAAAIGTAGGAVLSGVFSGVARSISKRASLPEQQGVEIKALAGRTTRLENGMTLLVDLQDTELEAHKATLEALHGTCNGNVTDALTAISDGRAKYQNYLKEGKK